MTNRLTLEEEWQVRGLLRHNYSRQRLNRRVWRPRWQVTALWGVILWTIVLGFIYLDRAVNPPPSASVRIQTK